MKPLWLDLCALGFLSAFRLWKRRQRLTQLEAAAQPSLTGKGFDASQIQLRLGPEGVRHAEISRRRRRATAAQDEFAAKVRQSLREMSFFAESRAPGRESGNTASEQHFT